MILLKYDCKVNFVKLPLIWNWSVLKPGFRKCHCQPQHRLPLGCELRELLVAASADAFWCGLQHPKCDKAKHLALPPSHCKPVLSSIPTHNNPVGLSLETWLAVLLMICNEQNPGPSTSGTPHNKFSKMPPPTSIALVNALQGTACCTP